MNVAEKKDPEDIPQFNYRHPGEPETLGEESKETPGDEDDKEVLEQIEDEQEAAEAQREAQSEGGVSPNRGQSDPKTQKEIDDMNTSSEAR